MARKRKPTMSENDVETGASEDVLNIPSEPVSEPPKSDPPEPDPEPSGDPTPAETPRAKKAAGTMERLLTVQHFARESGNGELVKIFAKLHQAENRTVKRTKAAWQAVYDVWLKEKR